MDGANAHCMCLVGANLLELDELPVKRPSPRRTTQGMCMDKGYDSPVIGELVSMFGFRPHIRYRPRRWVVERTYSWYNRFRNLLIRWCKKDENVTAQLQLASAIICGSFIALSGQVLSVNVDFFSISTKRVPHHIEGPRPLAVRFCLENAHAQTCQSPFSESSTTGASLRSVANNIST